MDDIRTWLSSAKDYDAGAKLYMIHGTDKLLKNVFREPPSPFKKKRLEEELKALLTKKKKVVQEVKASKETVIERVAVADRKWPEELDPTLKALKAKWKPLFAEMMNLSARIYDVALAGQTDLGKKEEAGRMAHKILDLDDACDAIYEQRDHYLKYKKLPDDKKPMELVVDVKKIPLAFENAKRYVRQYKAKLLKNPADVGAAKNLEKYTWAVAEYKKILNLDE